MSMEELLQFLQDNHFYPSVLKSGSGKAVKVTGYMIEAPTPFLLESKRSRLKEILAPYPVKIEEKDGHLLISTKKVANSKK